MSGPPRGGHQGRGTSYRAGGKKWVPLQRGGGGGDQGEAVGPGGRGTLGRNKKKTTCEGRQKSSGGHW